VAAYTPACGTVNPAASWPSKSENDLKEKSMCEASCHCGNITLKLKSLPTTLTECNCSICNRVGALWAYYSADEVEVSWSRKAPTPYVWGKKKLIFHHCPICGNTTHDTSTDKSSVQKITVNARMMSPEEIKGIKIRKFDGANTWKYLDE
jgi:hypothetical protein